jgi:hypothetical protein
VSKKKGKRMDEKKSEVGSATFLTIGGACSLIQSVLYIVAVAALWQTPVIDLLSYGRAEGTDSFLAAYAVNPLPVVVMCVSFIFLALLGFIAVIPATAMFLGEQQNGWLKVGKYIGMLSLGVTTVYFTWFVLTVPALLALYSSADSATKAVVAALCDCRGPTGWISWFMFGGMGFWVAEVGAATFRNRSLSTSFAAPCAVKTCGFWLALAGIVFQNAPLVIAGAIAGGLIGGPIYHAWLGTAMIRDHSIAHSERGMS